MTTPSLRDKIWRLLAMSLDPDSSTPQLHALILEGEADQPLMLDGRILLFRDPKIAKKLLVDHGRHIASNGVDVDVPFFWCDVAQTLYLLQAGGVDDEACVLGAANALLDLVSATGLQVPADFKAALHSIANYCTTEKDLTRYLEEDGDYSSEALTNAVLWCVGAIAVKSTLIT